MVVHKLAGIAINPLERGNISIQINHDQQSIIDQAARHVNVNNLRFGLKDVKIIMDWIKKYGLIQGIPYDIEITSKTDKQVINLYLDPMEALRVSRDGIEASIKMLYSYDWQDDKVDGFTLESMYNETKVDPFTIDNVKYNSFQEYFDKKCIYIPYIISTVPNSRDAFLATLAITFIVNELYKVIKQITQWATPISGFGIVVAVIQLVAEIAYAVLLVVTLIGLITQLIESLIQPIKYHGAMLMSDMLKVVAVKLGLNASSSIWDNYPFNQLAYLPEKYNPLEGNSSSFSLLGSLIPGVGITNKGYTSPAKAPSTVHDSNTSGIQHGFFNGTAGDFLRLIKSITNSKLIIPDGTKTLLVERRDFHLNDSQFQLPDLRQDHAGYNVEDLYGTMLLKFAVDYNDRNIIDHVDPSGNRFYEGTILQATHLPAVVLDQRLVLLKGLREINLQVARGVAKDELTFVENLLQEFKPIWDGIADTAESIANFAIDTFNHSILFVINGFISVWNAIVTIVNVILSILSDIADAIDALSLGLLDVHIPRNIDELKLKPMDPVKRISIGHINIKNNRLNALLLENDMVSVPKLLLIDTARTEFTSERIAYIHKDNAKIVSTQYLWDKFYSIDAMADPLGKDNHNRFTKISPSLNTSDEKNPASLSLNQIKQLVSNPKFKDNFGEDVIADTVEWFPETGVAYFDYRKKGWLADPQNRIGTKRKQEIAVNLNLKISLPNGQ